MLRQLYNSAPFHFPRRGVSERGAAVPEYMVLFVCLIVMFVSAGVPLGRATNQPFAQLAGFYPAGVGTLIPNYVLTANFW